MWWFGVAGSAVGVGLGIGLVIYGRTFPSKRSFMGRTGIPVPPAPWDQRRTLMGGGMTLTLFGLIAMLVFFGVAMSV